MTHFLVRTKQEMEKRKFWNMLWWKLCCVEEGDGVTAWKRETAWRIAGDLMRTVNTKLKAPTKWCWGGGWCLKERNWLKDCKISNENYKNETKGTNWVAHRYAIFLCSWGDSLVGQLTTNWVMLRWGRGLLPLAICTLALVRSQDLMICHSR